MCMCLFLNISIVERGIKSHFVEALFLCEHLAKGLKEDHIAHYDCIETIERGSGWTCKS